MFVPSAEVRMAASDRLADIDAVAVWVLEHKGSEPIVLPLRCLLQGAWQQFARSECRDRRCRSSHHLALAGSWRDGPG
ncbi:MAG: hypothetical protein WCE35_22455, partial [Bradyrhizobium sp.]